MKKALTILLAAVFLLACYVPVSAADWGLYGSARVKTWWTDFSEERGDVTTLDHSLQGNARIGANVDAGPIGGRFEYGASGGNANIRLLYATFDLGPGEVLVGQTYGPYGMGSFISGQKYGDDAGLLQFIGYTSRKPMVQYSIDNLKVALVQPVDVGSTLDAQGNVIFASPEVQLPMLQASYDINVEGMAFNLAGAVQSYDLDAGDGDTLTAWGLALNARMNMLDPAYINFGGFYGQNVSQIGQWSITNNSYAGPDNDIEDTDTYGLALVLGTQLPSMTLEAGVGYAVSENDLWAEDDEVMAYYAQARIPVMANATITPEIGFYDYNDDPATGNDDGDEFYVGLQWRVDF